jgi:hypothetical protein
MIWIKKKVCYLNLFKLFAFPIDQSGFSLPFLLYVYLCLVEIRYMSPLYFRDYKHQKPNHWVKKKKS